jgi:hypothetical protein
MQNTTVQFLFENGQLIPVNNSEQLKLSMFQKTLKEGEHVEMYLTVVSDADKTPAQLSKVHAGIRDLSTFTGHSFEDVKLMVKEKAGIYVNTESGSKEYKSFSKCDKEELSAAIQATLEIGRTIGCYLD